MPALSSTMTEGKIVSWVKEEGDAISKGEAVVVVESDKADMDVESFYDGFLAHICVEDGEMATVGAPIAYVAETEAEIPEAEAKAAAASGGGAAPAPAPAAAPAAEAAPAAPAPAAEAPAPAAPAPAPAPVVNTGRIIATPYAKKLAKKSKIKLETIKGTGLNGRITGEDVEKAAGIAPAAKPAAPAAAQLAKLEQAIKVAGLKAQRARKAKPMPPETPQLLAEYKRLKQQKELLEKLLLLLLLLRLPLLLQMRRCSVQQQRHDNQYDRIHKKNEVIQHACVQPYL